MIIGLDVGGTNIDIVAIENAKVVEFGKVERGSDLINSMLKTLEKFVALRYNKQIDRVVLSTTITTNAIVQKSLDKVGMVIEPGIGANPDYLMCGDVNVILDGYINNRGISIKRFNTKLINSAADRFKKEDIHNIGIVTKFSVRNPQHEIEVFDILKDYQFDFISLGHRISGKLNFPRRVFSTYLNSAVYTKFNMFVQAVSTLLSECQISLDKVHIQKPDGGILKIDAIKSLPIMSILSGPAASAYGAYILSKPNCDAITLDMGGTTTDISFIYNGKLVLEHYGARIGDYPTLVRAIYSKSIGLGGDSIIKLQDGKIEIGPETIRCHQNVKTPITLTDILRYLSDKNNQTLQAKLQEFLNMNSNSITLENLCSLTIKMVVKQIKNEIQNCIDYINNTPIYTINKLIYGEKFLPKEIILIGGPAELIKPYLEKELNFKITVPRYYMVANAIGCALGSITKEYNMVADTNQRILSIPELGVFENISSDLSLNQAKDMFMKKIIEKEKNISFEDIEIIEENSFNIIRSFRFCGKIIKIKAQLKPKIQTLH